MPSVARFSNQGDSPTPPGGVQTAILTVFPPITVMVERFAGAPSVVRVPGLPAWNTSLLFHSLRVAGATVNKETSGFRAGFQIAPEHEMLQNPTY